jgi:hypothetical protein
MVALSPIQPDGERFHSLARIIFLFTGEGSGELLGQNLSFPGSIGHYPCVNHAYYKAFPSLSTPSHGGDTGSIPVGTTIKDRMNTGFPCLDTPQNTVSKLSVDSNPTLPKWFRSEIDCNQRKLIFGGERTTPPEAPGWLSFIK